MVELLNILLGIVLLVVIIWLTIRLNRPKKPLLATSKPTEDALNQHQLGEVAGIDPKHGKNVLYLFPQATEGK